MSKIKNPLLEAMRANIKNLPSCRRVYTSTTKSGLHRVKFYDVDKNMAMRLMQLNKGKWIKSLQKLGFANVRVCILRIDHCYTATNSIVVHAEP